MYTYLKFKNAFVRLANLFNTKTLEELVTARLKKKKPEIFN